MHVFFLYVFLERSTKTRNGTKSGDQRAVTPKMFAQPGNEYCPVKMLRLYISKRPEDLRNDPSSRFYLRPLTTTTSDIWYSHQPVGKNKLGLMMKNLATQAEIMGRKVNHSTRKTFASALLQSDRPNTEVAQLGGWKSVSTLTHYNVPSLKQQSNASKILSETVIPVENCEDKENVLEETKESTHAEDNVETHVISDGHTDNGDALSVVDKGPEGKYSLYSGSQSALTNTCSSNVVAYKNQKENNPYSILFGSSITGGTININIYSGKRKFEVDSSQD